jgi:hypothetical protein
MLRLLLILAAVIVVGFAFYQHVAIRTLIRNAIGDFEMSVSASFRLYSQRLNAFVTLVVLPYIISTNGGFVAQVFNALPETYRIIAAPFAGMVAFAVVTWARLRIQPAKPNA